jgi:hypothetical protein
MYESVRRLRMYVGRKLTLILLSGSQYETDAADCVQELSWKWIVDFAADSCDMHVNHIIEGCIPDRCLPHIAGNHFTRNDGTAIHKEIFEQFEFPSGQVNLDVIPNYGVTSNIHFEIGDLKRRGRFGIGSTMQRAYSREKFWKCEWFNQVVIGT